MGKRGPKQISQVRREYLREEAARLMLQGWTRRRIAEFQERSPKMVNYDVDVMVRRWQQAQVHDIDAYKAIQFKKLDALWAELWESWQRSKEDSTSVRARTKRVPIGVSLASAETEDDGQEGGTVVERVEHEESVIKERRDGDPRFLELMLRVVAEQSKLKGAYPKDQPEQKEESEPVRRVVVYLPAKKDPPPESDVIDVTPGGNRDDEYDTEDLPRLLGPGP